MKIEIWDLDQTVINTSHRYATLENGDIDLPHWITNCVPEKIIKDSLLPLITVMRKGYEKPGTLIVICTSRVMSIWDWKFLADNSVPYHLALHRPAGNKEPDATLKRRQLVDLFKQLKMSPHVFFQSIDLWDDNPTIRHMAAELGITAWDSVILNERFIS